MKLIKCVLLSILLSFFSCAPSIFITSSESLVVHKLTNVAFPKEVGSFERTSYQAYDDKGKDIGVGYQIRDFDCVVTVSFFIYPTYGKTLQEEFTSVNDAIEEYNPGAKLINIETLTDEPFEGKKGVFSRYEVKNGYTVTYFFEKEQKFYKYRISYPSSTKNKSEKEIEFFLKNFEW